MWPYKRIIMNTYQELCPNTGEKFHCAYFDLVVSPTFKSVEIKEIRMKDVNIPDFIGFEKYALDQSHTMLS